jgi:hypothetical protein
MAKHSNFILPNGVVAHNCKAHASSYAVDAYACAFLKYHYPLEWWSSVLTYIDKDLVDTKFWQSVGSILLLPDIKKSKQSFAIEGDKIRAPLSLINGLGDKAFDQLIAMGPYENIQDLCDKNEQYKVVAGQKEGKLTKAGLPAKGRSAVGSAMICKLIIAGVCDGLFPEVDDFGAPTTTEDRLRLFAEAEAKTLGKRKAKNYAAEFSLNDPLLKYQTRRSILTSYSEPLIPLVMPLLCSKYKKTSIATLEFRRREYTILPGASLERLEKLNIPLRDGINYAGIGYVIKDEKKMYKDKVTGAMKTRCLLLVDFDGFRKEMMYWPDKDGQLPDSIKEELDGCIVACYFYKTNAGKIYNSGLEMLSQSLKRKVEENESSESSA